MSKMINEKKSCFNCTLKKHSLFCSLSNPELEQIESRRKELNYKKGEVIFKEGTRPISLYCLNSGKVKIVKTLKDDIEQIIELKKPVDFLGFQALMSGDDYGTSAVAIEATGLCSIHRDDFFEVLSGSKDLAIGTIIYLAKSLNTLSSLLFNLTQKNMKARLCDVLLLLIDVYGLSPDGSINVQLKRKELASLSNMITSNVIRNLSELTREKVISLNGKHILIHNMAALQKMAMT